MCSIFEDIFVGGKVVLEWEGALVQDDFTRGLCHRPVEYILNAITFMIEVN